MSRSKTREATLIIVLIISVLVGCEPDSKPTTENNSNKSSSARPVREVQAEVVKASNTLGLEAYAHLGQQPGNQVISPACITTGLSLLYTGARGETGRQIAHVMHADSVLHDGVGSYGSLIKDLNADGAKQSYQVRLANALWVQKGYPLLDSFQTTLKDVFQLEGSSVDFAHQPAETCRTINDWVKAHTAGKITRVFDTDDLPDRARLALTTALYLRANWTSRFEKEATKDAPFHLDRQKTVKVPMMHKGSTWKVHSYLDGGSFQAMQFPLGARGEMTMVVFLPREIDGLPEFEASLNTDVLQSWWPRFRLHEDVVISLPRFRVQTKTGLTGLLSRLGMPLAFEPEADFSGINGKRADLFVARAQHSTYLDVDESGVEGAASTGTISADSFGDEEPPQFHADHPFFFLIRDTRSGLVLFMGRVVNPLQENAPN